MPSRLVSFIVAEGVSIDQLTSRFTAFNIMDHAMVSGIPAMLIRAAVVTHYELGPDPEEFSERVALLDPGGQVVRESRIRLTLPARGENGVPNGHRSVQTFWKLKLEVPGSYEFRLWRAYDGAEEELLARQTLDVVVQRHAMLNAQAPQHSMPDVSKND